MPANLRKDEFLFEDPALARKNRGAEDSNRDFDSDFFDDDQDILIQDEAEPFRVGDPSADPEGFSEPAEIPDGFSSIDYALIGLLGTVILLVILILIEF